MHTPTHMHTCTLTHTCTLAHVHTHTPHSVNHLAEWFRIVSTHPGVADNLYSVNSFLATTGEQQEAWDEG